MIAIVDYGIGNVTSLLNAFSRLGIEASLTKERDALFGAHGVILPGVGAFGEGMRRIKAGGLAGTITIVRERRIPVLGICLGFQLLMRSSQEMGLHRGLDFMPFDVVSLPTVARLPHIGWSRVRTASTSERPQLLADLDGEHFYFCHSYGVVDGCGPDLRAATTSYGETDFVSVVEVDTLFGAQFHPERSGEAGLRLLTNFARISGLA